MNSHDGTGAIKAAMTPIRVVCQNTLNLALATAKRSWSVNHVGDIEGKLEDAKDTLLYAGQYMAELGKEIDVLSKKRLTDRQVYEYIDALFPAEDGATAAQRRNLSRLKDEVRVRYFDAPRSAGYGQDGLPLRQRGLRLCHPCQAHPGAEELSGEPVCPHRGWQRHDRQGISDDAGGVRCSQRDPLPG